VLQYTKYTKQPFSWLKIKINQSQTHTINQTLAWAGVYCYAQNCVAAHPLINALLKNEIDG
jgi:hypothetical protein